MFDTEKAIALSRWIKEWKNTYGESPSIEECITWIEWKFEDNILSDEEKIKIKTLLNFSKS